MEQGRNKCGAGDTWESGANYKNKIRFFRKTGGGSSERKGKFISPDYWEESTSGKVTRKKEKEQKDNEYPGLEQPNKVC